MFVFLICKLLWMLKVNSVVSGSGTTNEKWWWPGFWWWVVEAAGVDMTVLSWGPFHRSLLFAALKKVTSATDRQVIVVIVSSWGFLFLTFRKQEKHPKRIDFDMSKSAAVRDLAVVMKPQLESLINLLLTFYVIFSYFVCFCFTNENYSELI